MVQRPAAHRRERRGGPASDYGADVADRTARPGPLLRLRRGPAGPPGFRPVLAGPAGHARRPAQPAVHPARHGLHAGRALALDSSHAALQPHAAALADRHALGRAAQPRLRPRAPAPGPQQAGRGPLHGGRRQGPPVALRAGRPVFLRHLDQPLLALCRPAVGHGPRPGGIRYPCRRPAQLFHGLCPGRGPGPALSAARAAGRGRRRFRRE